MGIGIIANGAWLGVWGGFKRKMLTSMLGLMGMGAGTLLMAIAPPSALLMVVTAALIVGIMTLLTKGPFFAIIQSFVEPDMQARIIPLLSSVEGGMVPIGLMIAGPIADHAGIKTWFFLGGILCILMSIAGLFIQAVMEIENHQSRTLAKSGVEA